MSEKDSVSASLARTIIYAIILVAVLAATHWLFSESFLARMIGDYESYAVIIVTLALGWMIVNAVASMFYAMAKQRYGASTAAAVRSMIKILGLGALLAGIAGGVAGGAAGVALGGFIGLVIGFATQQVLGQTVAGMFILLARPFKIGDLVDIAGESEVRVKDISTMFTVVQRKDGTEVLIPSSMIIGSKIVVRERSRE